MAVFEFEEATGKRAWDTPSLGRLWLPTTLNPKP